jgi:L-seryl-tRNA(Ser) seleniumtransferase
MPKLREVPSVDEVLRRMKAADGLPAGLVKNEIRAVLADLRAAMRSDNAVEDRPVEEVVAKRLSELKTRSLRRVINATGVVLHTNLGRAPLVPFEPICGYSNLEYDLASGLRGRREDHLLPLLERLFGKTAVVVNNNAAAVYLALNELAAGGEVIVSRGELIEIGDGFRIPDIMTRSGAVLREVGTTNRTRIEDYEQAISERTRLILRVHRSNFRISGFTARPTASELTLVAKRRGVPIFEDLGSGSLLNLSGLGIHEPTVQQSFAAGIQLVAFSCDKLLGGPQAGIVAGDQELVMRLRRNPMYRAFRVDKLIIQSLETTLRHLLYENWRELPAMRMIMASPDELRKRAERVAARLDQLDRQVRQTASLIGGGATPEQKLPTWVIELSVADAAGFERRLREAATPVIARIEQDKVILDLRTVAEDEEEELIRGVTGASG